MTAILVAMVKAIMCNMIGVRRWGLVVVMNSCVFIITVQSVIYLKMFFYVFFLIIVNTLKQKKILKKYQFDAFFKSKIHF